MPNGQILADPLGAIDQGYEMGERHARRRRIGEAYEQGGLDAVADASAQWGDLQTYGAVRGEQRNARRFENEQQQAVYDRMEAIRPFALGALNRVGQFPPERRGEWLNQPHIRQRFLDFGISPEYFDQGVALISNPETADATLAELQAAFAQHQQEGWRPALPEERSDIPESVVVDVGPDGQRRVVYRPPNPRATPALGQYPDDGYDYE